MHCAQNNCEAGGIIKWPAILFLDPERQARDLIQSLFLFRVSVLVCHTKFIVRPVSVRVLVS